MKNYAGSVWWFGEKLKNMFLIVGLGNPERKYFNTYHNIGFMTVDLLSEKTNARPEKQKCLADVQSFECEGKTVFVAKPLTYMNLSGNSLIAFKKKYGLENNQILVVADDIDLPVGKFRFRKSGSGGTHNGLKNIVDLIGSDFSRIRIGVGKPENNEELSDYILNKIPETKKQDLTNVIHEVVLFILNLIKEDDSAGV